MGLQNSSTLFQTIPDHADPFVHRIVASAQTFTTWYEIEERKGCATKEYCRGRYDFKAAFFKYGGGTRHVHTICYQQNTLHAFSLEYLRGKRRIFCGIV